MRSISSVPSKCPKYLNDWFQSQRLSELSFFLFYFLSYLLI